MTAVLGDELHRLLPRVTTWLDEANGIGGQEISLRIMKVGEEYGEAVAAWIGVTGQNPRKGETHNSGDVAAELADVVIAALVAIASLGHDPDSTVASRTARLTARLDEP
ncbi:MAG: MazG-like family protein [Stackebrandtia sp.]